MARLIFIIAVLLLAGWYVWKGYKHTDDDSNFYNASKTIEMINRLESPAAGRDDQ